jgi:hypothetical protein
MVDTSGHSAKKAGSAIGDIVVTGSTSFDPYEAMG